MKLQFVNHEEHEENQNRILSFLPDLHVLRGLKRLLK